MPASIEALINECRAYQIEGIEDVETVVDLGAHFGLFANYARHLYPDARIECYEPDPSNYERLIESWPEAFQVAIGDEYRKARFNATADDCSFVAEAKPNESFTNEIEVDVVSLAAILAEMDHVDILKVDIEGSEVPVFMNAPIETMRKIRYITMEFHIWHSDADREALLAKLSETHEVEIQLRPPVDDIWRAWRR